MVYNDACSDGEFPTLEAAAAAVGSLSLGLATLAARDVISQTLRMPRDPSQIKLGEGIHLHEALLTLLSSRNDREAGRFFASLALKIPIEDDLTGSDFGRLVEWHLPDYPGALGLLLCAISGRIAVTSSNVTTWHQNQLKIRVSHGSCHEDEVEEHSELVDHVFSQVSADKLLERELQGRRAEISAQELWASRADLFAKLRFGRGVEADLQRLSVRGLRAAVARLSELNESARLWETESLASPAYFSRVSGESAATMAQYGRRRMFQDAAGNHHTFEKHARIADGFRVHLREIAGLKIIEIGYIGPHLPTVKFPN